MPEVSIRDLCTVIRSKQAGPYRLTLDIIFKTAEIYQRVKASATLTRERIADLYCVPEDQITDFVFYDPGWAVKVTMIRPKVAGDPGDGDVYACQQHAPLLGLRLELPSESAGTGGGGAGRTAMRAPFPTHGHREGAQGR
jgi:uncharacterized protein DUF4387